MGELIDRITILEIKVRRLPRRVRPRLRRDLVTARRARDGAVSRSPRLARLTAQLRAVNCTLWAAEERVRACARGERFGHEFVALARKIQRENDRRAALKREIDALVGSRVREYKSHALPRVRV